MMKKMKARKILYVGNNLASKTKYPTTMETLSSLLIQEGYLVYKTSNKNNIFFRLIDMLITTIKLRNKVDFVLIDTYSTLNFYYAFIISQIARFFKIKYIPILHGGNLPSRVDKSKNYSKMIFNNSFKNIAPSNYLKSEFNRRGFSVDFIPNVLEINQYKFKQREYLEPKLLIVRAFAKIYNLKMAVNIVSQLKVKFNNVKLCIIGPDRDGSQKEIEMYIEEKGLEENIEITGVLTKKEWHKKSKEFNVFINTTNVDNTPVSVIEAMALGLPIVSTNVGGIPYLIDNFKDGILVDKNDTDDMTDKIIKLIENPNLVIELTKNARIKVAKFDWNIVKNQWSDLLN